MSQFEEIPAACPAGLCCVSLAAVAILGGMYSPAELRHLSEVLRAAAHAARADAELARQKAVEVRNAARQAKVSLERRIAQLRTIQNRQDRR